MAVEHVIEIPYSPRPLQRTLHAALDTHRFSVAVCHRRFGKTVCAINQLIKCALTNEREAPRYAYIAPLLKQGKGISWDYMKKYSAPIPGHQVNESELRIDYPNGGRIRIYGADNPDALRGIYLDGVVLDEYGNMDSEVWTSVLRPALTDRNGWALFIGTPNGKNQFYDIVRHAQRNDDWYYAEYKASETGLISEQELADTRAQQTADEYDREMECSFETSVEGAIYEAEMRQAREQGRITQVPYDPALKVCTDWDLGIDDSTAIWFTQTTFSGAIRVIDYYENAGEGLHHYADVISRKRYVYETHYAPHDIEQRELGSGQSLRMTAFSLGLNFVTTDRISQNAAWERIYACRHVLPRCYFDEHKCGPGLEALKHYRWAEVKGDNPTSRQLPVHDWASHAADAFGQFAYRHKDRRRSMEKENAADVRRAQRDDQETFRWGNHSGLQRGGMVRHR